MTTGNLRQHRYAIVGMVCAVAILAAACGSKSNSSQGTTDTTGGQTSMTLAAEGAPQYGGAFVMGLEAESDGFNPTSNRWAISGTEVGMAVFDPLVAFDANKIAQPYLAESLTPNADYTVWDIKVRPNVTFQDGTPLDGAAITTMMKAHKASALTGPAVAPIQTIETTGPLTSRITMSSPWVAFPSLLTSQVGMVPAPSMFDADGKATDASSRKPVGTGPFAFTSWEPDKSFKATKYAKYWRTGMPYLDSIEFRPIPDDSARTSALRTNDINMIHTSSFQQISSLRQLAKDGKLQLVEDLGESEEGFLIINTQDPALSDVRVRHAMALAVDRKAYQAAINAGISEDATGVFKPSSKWYAKTDYPDYDPAAAKALVAEYTKETGKVPTFEIGTTPNPENQQAVALLQQNFNDVGMKTTIKTSEQSAFVADGVFGKYQVNLWRQFGSVDPDTDAVWWYGSNASGVITLNIARNIDPKIDDALNRGRQSTDEATRKQAYADLQTQMAKDFPYIWLNHSLWAIAAGNNVRGITNGDLPDGQPSLPIGGAGDFGGVVRFTQTWLTK